MFRYTLIGVLTDLVANMDTGDRCDPDHMPQMWVRVTEVMDWLTLNMKEGKKSNCEDIYKNNR